MKSGFKRLIAVVLPLMIVAALVCSFAIASSADGAQPDNQVYLSVEDNIVSHYIVDTAYYKAKGCDEMQYTYNGSSNHEAYTLAYSDMIPLSSTGTQYQFDIEQAAAQLAEPTGVKVYKNGAVYDSFSFSAYDYCDKIIKMDLEELIIIDQKAYKLTTLCKSIIAYAKAAQALFPTYMNNPGTVQITDDYSDDLGLATANYIPEIQVHQGTSVRFQSASFICSSSAGMRFYLAKGSDKDALEVTGPTGIIWEKGIVNGVLRYIEITGIKPIFFWDNITVKLGRRKSKISERA